MFEHGIGSLEKKAKDGGLLPRILILRPRPLPCEGLLDKGLSSCAVPRTAALRFVPRVTLRES